MKRTFSQYFCDDIMFEILDFLSDEDVILHLLQADNVDEVRSILKPRSKDSKEWLAYEVLKNRKKDMFLWIEREYELQNNTRFLELFAYQNDLEEVRRRIKHPSLTATQLVTPEIEAIKGGAFEAFKEINTYRNSLTGLRAFLNNKITNYVHGYKSYLSECSENGHLDFIHSYIEWQSEDVRDMFPNRWISLQTRSDILYGAGRGGQIHIIEDFRSKGEVDWISTLKGCASAGRIELINKIIDRYALINTREIYGYVIKEASAHGQLETFQYYEHYGRLFLHHQQMIDLRNVVPRGKVLDYLLMSEKKERYQLQKKNIITGIWMDDRVDLLKAFPEYLNLDYLFCAKNLLSFNSLKCFIYSTKDIENIDSLRKIFNSDNICTMRYYLEDLEPTTLLYILDRIKPLHEDEITILKEYREMTNEMGRHELVDTIEKFLKENVK